MASVRIIFATTGGNTMLVCEKVAETLQSAGHTATLTRAEQADSSMLTDSDFLILASPTYGHGLLDPQWEKFYNTIQDADLAGQSCAVIGLGDTKYDFDYHIESAGILSKYIVEHGGKLAVPLLAIDKSPIPHLETKVKEWGEGVNEQLSTSNEQR